MIEKNLVVLISSLKADIGTLIDSINVQTDVIIVNQCDVDDFEVHNKNGFDIYVHHSKQRGLSKSRNMALDIVRRMDYDYLLFSDDDVKYVTGFNSIIVDSFDLKADADIICFDINRLNYLNFPNKSVVGMIPSFSIKTTRKHTYFGSVRICIKNEFIKNNELSFNERFGTGSGFFSHGEDSIFLKDCRKLGAVVYQSNDIIANVDFSESTWRNMSFTEMCFDKGAVWKELSPFGFPLYGLVLVFKMSREESEPFFKNYLSYIKGACSYRVKG